MVAAMVAAIMAVVVTCPREAPAGVGVAVPGSVLLWSVAVLLVVVVVRLERVYLEEKD